MATPQITLTAQLGDLTGNADPRSKIRITLCGFGGLMPKVIGTAMLAKALYEQVQTGSSISIQIWGNDVIKPDGTFYCIEIIDSKGVRVQAGNYQLTGSGTQDLSTLPQYLPPPPLPIFPIPIWSNPIGGGTQTIHGSLIIDGDLTVTGTINGNQGGGLVVVPYAANIVFNGSQGRGFKTVLTGDTNLTISNMNNQVYIAIVFQQDGTGGHNVNWPANIFNHGEVNPGPGMRSSQVFMADTDGSLIAVSTMQYSAAS